MLSELQRFPRQFQVQQSSQQQQPANTFFNPQQFQNIPQTSQRFVSPGFFNSQPQSTQQQQQQQQINQFGFPSGQGRVEVSSLPQPRFQPQSGQSQLGIPPQSQFQVQTGANGVQQQSQQSLFEQQQGLFDQQSFFNQFQPQPNSVSDNQPQSAFQQNIFQPNSNPFTQQSLTPSQSNFQTAFSEVSRRAQSLGGRNSPALQNPAPVPQSLQINSAGRVTPSSVANPAATSPQITLFSPTLPPAGGQTRPVPQAGRQGLSFFPATPAPQQTSSGQGQGILPGGNRQAQFRYNIIF